MSQSLEEIIDKCNGVKPGNQMLAAGSVDLQVFFDKVKNNFCLTETHVINPRKIYGIVVQENAHLIITINNKNDYFEFKIDGYQGSNLMKYFINAKFKNRWYFEAPPVRDNNFNSLNTKAKIAVDSILYSFYSYLNNTISAE